MTRAPARAKHPLSREFAIRCAKRALEIDPNYREARDLIQRFQQAPAASTLPARR